MHGVTREAFSDERVDIDAQVYPFVADQHVAWDSSMHLIGHDLLGSIAEHQSAFGLKGEYETLIR